MFATVRCRYRRQCLSAATLIQLRSGRLARVPAFATFSQWSLTGGVEKSLATFSNGTTVGITADVLIPVSTTSVGAGDTRMGAFTSRTIRAGIVFRW